MEKKKYIKPLLTSEEFVPQEYCAACGDVQSGQNYRFKCNLNMMGQTYAEVFTDLNKDGVIDTNPGTHDYLGQMIACNKEHITPKSDLYLLGKVRIPGHYDDLIDVRIWTEEGTDLHCTTNLDIDSWETVTSKS